MNIKIYHKNKQAYGEFNGGEIVENKPIGFPQDGGALKPYSNLFYWAHAKANKESLIGLHPHRGFEIMSVVLKGKMEHYDTSDEKWSPLSEGDVQLIRAGSGISHAEKMMEGSEMFQIWFDPGLQKTLGKKASYDNYGASDFEKLKEGSANKKIIKNSKGPVRMDSEDIEIMEYVFETGDHNIQIEKDKVYSIYLIEGKLKIEDEQLQESDFAVIDEVSVYLPLTVEEESRIFVISSPPKPSYKTYYELSGW